ncbi:hypothetical protein GCM10010505_48830 [Kitasatospora aburaviensis]
MDPEPPLWDRVPRLPPDAAPVVGLRPGERSVPPNRSPSGSVHEGALVVIGPGAEPPFRG